jgi:hypothetical protein
MQTIRRAAAVLIYPAILCLGVACERTDTPTSSPPASPRADLTAPAPNTDWLARALSLGILVSDDPRAIAWTDEDESDEANDPIKVVPFDFDPFKTSLVRARWLRGIGCPTNATTNDGSTASSYTDTGCPTGDSKENPGRNEGLLLVKTGPTTNFASAGAELKGVRGITLTELGYDIRKGPTALGPNGSHRGAGAPRFNVVTTDGVNHFLGCNSPPGVVMASSAGWTRLRWVAVAGIIDAFPPIASPVQSITIIFDEGQDTGPDFIGLAVLDNIDVNGTLVGRGPGN